MTSLIERMSCCCFRRVSFTFLISSVSRDISVVRLPCSVVVESVINLDMISRDRGWFSVAVTFNCALVYGIVMNINFVFSLCVFLQMISLASPHTTLMSAASSAHHDDH